MTCESRLGPSFFQVNKMASDKEAESLRKQIDVLSSLIHTHKQLTEKEHATKNNNWKIADTKNNINPKANKLSNYGNAKSSGTFKFDRRKRQFMHESNPGSANLNLIPSTKPSLSRDSIKADVPSKESNSLKNNRLGNSSAVDQIPKPNLTCTSKTGGKTIFASGVDSTQTKTTKSSAEAALLSARLSSLSSSIASTKSKIQSSKYNTKSALSKPLLFNSPATNSLSKTTKQTRSNTNSSLLLSSKLSLNNSKHLKSSKSEYNTSGPKQLNIQNTSIDAPSTSSLKWRKDQGPTKKNTKGSLSKSSAFSWQKTDSEQLKSSNSKINSVPAAKSMLKWSKDGSLKDKSTFLLVNSAASRSRHVWRSKGSMKIDRRRRNSIGSSGGFMKRRQKVVQKAKSKRNASSRYRLVNSNKQKFVNSKTKVKSIEGVLYKTSANKLEKQDQAAGPLPKKSKHKSSKLLNISGKKYLMNASRKTLKRVHPEINQASTSNNTGIPSKQRLSLSKAAGTSPGSLVRSSPGRKAIASQMRRRSVQNALLYKYKKKAKSNQFCMFYNRFGKCNKGNDCPYIHDPSKIAVCTKFLKGKCDQTDGSCPFSHRIDKDKMPVCQFFLKDICTKEDCPYSHVNVSSNAEVCEDFVKGYCPLGQKCKEKHIVNCEEFMLTGKCSKGKKCNLMHRVTKPKKIKRKSLVKDDQISTAKRPKIDMTEEEGFLPLFNESTGKESTERKQDAVDKEKVQSISIKPRFLVNKDNQEQQG